MHPVLASLVKGARAALDPDRALQVTMGSLIEAAGLRYAVSSDPVRWREGEPLKLILAGYVGTRNTGADVRVEEMIRQFRALFGDDQVELSIMTVDKALSAGYFRTVRQVLLPPVFPKFLFEECPRHHGVIACEGSMFKSKFANALSTMMAGALGMANAEGKLSVGYGAEAGAMTPSLERFVGRQCRDSLVICRNDPSRQVLGRLGVRTSRGTDTAWTFEPAPPERGAELLRRAGWDGRQKVVGVCPINPFWWPVRPDLMKAAAHRLSGQFSADHYKSVYFHASSEEISNRFAGYLDALAGALRRFVAEHDAFPVLIGMEKVDRRACEGLAARLPFEAPVFVSDEHDMYDLVSVLRRCRALVSSRYHAIVTSMPGLVPSAGVTMDERIRNLMIDRGHEGLFVEVDDPDLEDRLVSILERLMSEGEVIAQDIARVLPGQLELMGRMGMQLRDEVVRVYPEFPLRDLPATWEAHLPPLPKALAELLEEA